MNFSKVVVTLMTQHFKLSKKHAPETEDEVTHITKVPHANAVGSLMYLIICTMQELAYAVSLVCRYMGNHGSLHWEALKWIFRYLRETSIVGLKYGRHNTTSLK